MIALVTSSREKARWAYTARGVVYGSLAWPAFLVVTLLIATWWTERPGWQPPQWPPRRHR